MVKPIQITFRNMPTSPALEEEIRARVAWLERYYPGLVGCRVLVEIPHRHRQRGRHLRVRIEMSLPGEDAVVSHEPTIHARVKDVEAVEHHKDTDIDATHKDALVAVHEAFDAARRRLKEFSRVQRGNVKMSAPPPMLPESEVW